MTKDALERVLSRAANAVASGALAGFTKVTIESEWNLARRLAFKIQRHLRELDCDTDVIKPDYGRKRPDIIFHIRNTHAKNFLVIETKYEGTPAAVRADVKKIKENWFRQPLRYRFGAVIFCATTVPLKFCC